MFQSRVSFLIVLLFTLLASAKSQAGWNEKAFDWGQRGFGSFPGPSGLSEMSRGTMAAVWGGGLREMKYGEDMSADQQEVKMPEFFKKKLRVYLRPAHDNPFQGPFPGSYESRRIKAPLMVFIPGVFGDADQAMAQGMMKLFSDMGYHVLLVPNCWSRDYHSAMPIERTEYPNDEANAILGLTKWAIRELGENYVQGSFIGGESLGALTAAVAYQKDSQASVPMFTGGATLFWPPIKLTRSIAVLDQMIVSTEKIYDNKCHSLLKKLKTKFRVWRGKFLTSPTKDEIECAPAVVAQFSFKKNLKELAERILKVNKVKESVPEDLTFATFIANYAHRYRSALKTEDRMGYLDYWLRSTSSSQLPKLQIITSSDDFINAGEKWSELSTDFKRGQLIVLPWGGHIGATNHSAFKKLVRYQFERK